MSTQNTPNNPGEPTQPLVTPEQTQTVTAQELQRIPQLQRDAFKTLVEKMMDAVNEAAVTANLDQHITTIGFRRGENGVFFFECDAPGLELPANIMEEVSARVAGIGQRTAPTRHRSLLLDGDAQG